MNTISESALMLITLMLCMIWIAIIYISISQKDTNINKLKTQFLEGKILFCKYSNKDIVVAKSSGWILDGNNIYKDSQFVNINSCSEN